MTAKQLLLIMVLSLSYGLVFGQGWLEGTLITTRGENVSGTFLFDQTYPEGMLIQKHPQDSSRVVTWPALKVVQLIHEEGLIKPTTYLTDKGIRQTILVEQIFEGQLYELMITKQPLKAFPWGEFLVGGWMWAQHANKIAYKQLVFLHHKENNETTLISTVGNAKKADRLDKLNEFPYNQSRLLKAMKVNVSKMKKLIQENKIKTKNLDGMVRLVQFVENWYGTN
ncbi:MAG: hypothetical protein R8G66_08245 [Cytophagales bacterium]|nr:hypothetical protein [Cytophagales bacterium]